METTDTRIGGIRYLEARGTMKCPDYMTKMIGNNPSSLLVPFEIAAGIDASEIIYETDLLFPLKTCLGEYGADEQWVKTFLHSVDSILAYCGEHLIDPGYICMDPGRIFLRGAAGPAVFLFNPYEKIDFAESCRKAVAEILGNYFSDHAVSGEIFRERLLRETADRGFNPRNILAEWEKLSYMEQPSEPEAIQTGHNAQRRRRELLKELLPGTRPVSDKTMAIERAPSGMFLTGICSINTRIQINTEGITVGRGMLQKDFGLYNSSIGRIHARVYEQGGKVFVTDLGSRNGTYINGEKISRRSPVNIEKGDIVAFSDEEFILC